MCPFTRTEWMGSVFKKETLSLLHFKAFGTVLSCKGPTHGLWSLETLLLCSESFYLGRHNLSPLCQIFISLQVLARAGKFHNDHTLFFLELCILCQPAYKTTQIFLSLKKRKESKTFLFRLIKHQG